ncbi:MAG: diguanylate cyclase [Spirochaetales bacterium]|nr:diguanylate cyclase [Spirochaetales bacterium]
MKDKILLTVPEKDSAEFLRERRDNNRRHLFYLSFVVLAVQIFFFSSSVLEPFTDHSTVLRAYRLFYLVSFTLTVLFTAALTLTGRSPFFQTKKALFLIIPYILILHMWSMGVAIADLFQGEEVVLYYVSMYALAILFDIGILEFIILLLSVFLVFTIKLSLLINYLGPHRDLQAAAFQHMLFATLIRFYIGELRRQNFIQRKELEFYSYYDSLSGLYNRRRWEQLYHDTYERAYREKRRLTLILADMDYFKQFNDTYGHVAGDEVVRQTSRILETSVKDLKGHVGRYGGDEFVIALIDMDQSGVEDLIARINRAIRELDVEHNASPQGKRLTLSIGYNQGIPDDPQKGWDFVVKADQDLYRTKAARENKIKVT